MVDKINLLNTANTQKSKNVDDRKIDKAEEAAKNKSVGIAVKEDAKDINISGKLNLSVLKESPPIDLEKVSAIKDAIAKGDYPLDLERISDALMQAYDDIK